MSAFSGVGRLKEMDSDELRFRLACEARKMAGRLRCAIHPPQWDRAAIVRVLDGGAGPLVARAQAAARRRDHAGAHRALAEHFRTRASAWPLGARDVPGLAAQIKDRFPEATEAARARADRILDGRHDLLGYRDVRLGNPPDWHADVIHQRSAPRSHWAAVPYLDPASGDHKVIWETNRHQYFLMLGSAYRLTGDRRYRDTFIAHLQDWLRANPPLRGVNWASMLELAFRAMSWTWAVEMFAGGGEDGEEAPWLLDLLVSLDRQLTHVAHNLSSYFSPNTHLSGEALALYAVSTAFPELRRSPQRAAAGREILLQEAHNQVRADGGHAELSPHYHRYSTDFYLLALMVARAANDAAAPPFEEAARGQAAYLRTIADDRGRLPMIGDDDGGQLFRFGGSVPADASATLAVAASVLDDEALAVSPATADAWWILGRPPREATGDVGAPWPSRVLPESGYLVSRSPGGGHLIFDAGPHGFLNGGHAHADALSVVLTVGGDPLLVDQGSGTYTMDRDTRDRFRSSRMHNTLVLDGQDHAEPLGPFRWQTRADARFLVARLAPQFDFAAGTHDAYGHKRHTRAVLSLHGVGWLIVDRVVTNVPTEAEAWWHFHPAWSATLCGNTVELQHASGRRLALTTTARDLSRAPDLAYSLYAPEYGRIEAATTVVVRHVAAAPFVVATFIPATLGQEPIGIDPIVPGVPPSAAWIETAFAIRTGRQDIQVRIPFPAGDLAQPQDDWPQPCITHRPVGAI